MARTPPAAASRRLSLRVSCFNLAKLPGFTRASAATLVRPLELRSKKRRLFQLPLRNSMQP